MKEKTTQPTLAPEHLRFAVIATDMALFTILNKKLFVRLVSVNRVPDFVAREGLPGGLILPEETAEEATLRILEAKAGIRRTVVHIEQLYTFSRVDRDPRGRVVAVAYLALVPWEVLLEQERGVHAGSRWSELIDAQNLAYDHDEILTTALARLRSRVMYTTLIQTLMPREFTLTELEEAYETVLGTRMDKRNFRKKIEKLQILEELPHKREGGRHRPARLYRFKDHEVKEIAII